MGIRENSIRYILDELLKRRAINENDYTNIYNTYINVPGITFKPRPQGDITNSNKFNLCLIESGIDISMLFSMLFDTDNTITKHQRLNEAILNNIKLDNRKNMDRLILADKRIKNNNRFVYYETFRDLQGYAKDIEVDYTYDQAYFDKQLEAIKLNYLSSVNALVSRTGARMGNIKILRQHSSAMSSLKNSSISIDKAIDPDIHSYWHECIITESPIEIPYETAVSNIKRGAVCELLVTLDFVSEVNEITLTPFCEFPMEVVEIQYSDNDEDEEFTPIVFKSSIGKSPDNEFLTNKLSTRVMNYQFANIKVKRIKILLNQIHYAPNNFVSKTENLKANGIFITDNNEELIKDILNPIQKAIMNETFEIPIERQRFDTNKLEYEYGLYNILVANNEYTSISEFISTPFNMNNSSIIALETTEEHYKINNIQATGIEYELLLGDSPFTKISILPRGTTEVKWELLNPYHDSFDNKMKAYLRFPADISIRDNLKLYKDNIEITNGFMIINNSQIELTEYDPYSNYCLTYKLKDPLLSTTYQLNEDQTIRLRAVLRKNSKLYSGVTPILYDFTILAIDMPLKVSELNELIELYLAPVEITTGLNSKIPIEYTDQAMLVQISIPEDEIIITLDDTVEVDEYCGEE